MKKTFLIIGIIVLGFIFFSPWNDLLVGGDILLTEEQKIEIVQTNQTGKLNKGHYKYVPRTYVGENDYQVDEYELNDGRVGYTITIWKIQEENVYTKVLNYGPLTDREMDWTLYEKSTSSLPQI